MKFLEVLKQLHVNIPLIDAIEQMSSYAKFLKEILTQKRRLEECQTVELKEDCSVSLLKQLPQELKDSGSLTDHIQSLITSLCLPIEPLTDHINSLSLDEMNGNEVKINTRPHPTQPPDTQVKFEDEKDIWERLITPPPPLLPPDDRIHSQRPPYTLLP